MSIVEVTMFQVKCDRCGAISTDGSDYSGWDDEIQARDDAQECDWEDIDGKDCCPGCWTWSENEEEIVFKPVESTPGGEDDQRASLWPYRDKKGTGDESNGS